MKFVRIKTYFINIDKINYINTSIYLESYHLEIFFDNSKSFSFTTKDRAEFNEWIFLLTGKEFDQK